MESQDGFERIGTGGQKKESSPSHGKLKKIDGEKSPGGVRLKSQRSGPMVGKGRVSLGRAGSTETSNVVRLIQHNVSEGGGFNKMKGESLGGKRWRLAPVSGGEKAGKTGHGLGTIDKLKEGGECWL